MRAFFYKSRDKNPPFDGLYEPIGTYQQIIFSHNLQQIKLFNQRSEKLVKELLQEAIECEPNDDTISPDDNSRFFIPLKMKKTFAELLKKQYKNTKWAEYKTTKKPSKFEMGLVGGGDLSRFYDNIKVQAVMSSDGVPDFEDNQAKPVMPVKFFLPVLTLLVLSLVGGLIGGLIYQSVFEEVDKPTDPLVDEGGKPKPEVIITPKPQTINEWAELLVSNLEKEVKTSQEIYINPLTLFISGQQQNSIDVFDTVLHNALTKKLKPLNPAAKFGSTSLHLLRKNAQRTLPKGMSFTAELINAHSELTGKVQISGEQAKVAVALINQVGAVAEETITFSKRLLDEQILATATARLVTPSFNRGDLTIEMSTSHGLYNVTYQGGEFLRLFIRTNKQAYIYVFVADVNQHTTRLYPESLSATPKQVNANELLILPEDGLPYELIVQKPFGKTILWAVASTNPLKFPKEMNETWIQWESLRKQVRQLGSEKASKGYAEATIVAETIEPVGGATDNGLSF